MRSTSCPLWKFCVSKQGYEDFSLVIFKKQPVKKKTVKSKCTESGIPHVLYDSLHRLENHH